MTTEQPNPELLLIRRKQLELQRRKNQLIRANGLAFYRPWTKQDAFHSAAKHKLRMFRAGNRTGKSTAGCAEDCAWALGERLWYHEGDPRRTIGIPEYPTKGLIVTTDWDKVDEIWTSERADMPGKLWQFLGRPGSANTKIVSTKRNHSGAIETVEVKSRRHNGNSLIKFDTVKSFKTNPMGAESSDWDWIHVDEPCPEGMFKAHARGLIDRNGSAWFTLTPLNEFWINDLFFPQDTGGLPRLGVWSESATIYENPYLSREAIAAYEALLTEEEKQCRLLGIPLHLAGLVYKSFSWAKHVLTEPPTGWLDWTHPPKHWPIYIHIDPHPQTPHAVLFCTVDPFGTRYYYFDMFRKCSIPDLAREILDFVRGYRIGFCKADPLAFIQHPVPNSRRDTGYNSMALEFEDNGLFVEEAVKALAHGIIKVNGQLAVRDNNNQPVIRFSPHCKRTLWEIQRYCWDDEADKPVDSEDHMMENLYRMELSEPRWLDFAQKCPEITAENILSPSFIKDEPVSLAL